MKILFYVACIILISIVVLMMFFVLRGYLEASRLVKNKPIREYYNEVQNSSSYCSIHDISANLKFIVVCLEDKGFFEHRGYSVRRIFNAAYTNIKRRKKKLGGSTITQQLAKNMYFSFRKTFKRKIAELFVARKLEKALTKEEILDFYFNIIYYGMEQYCIRDACRFYFQKHPSEVSVNQALTLGCLLPAPTLYNPLNEDGYFAKARKIALDRLVSRAAMEEEDVDIFLRASYDEDIKSEVALFYEKKYKENYEKLSTKKIQ